MDKQAIYVIGHKNPDADSIVSAIAYSEYLKTKGKNVIAGRIGPVTSDVEYLLERFKYEEPLHLYTAKSIINDIDYDKVVLVSKDITIAEALNKLLNTVTKTIIVVDKKKNLVGLLSLSNLNRLWAAEDEELIKLLKTASFENIVKILKAEIINKAKSFNINGYVELAPVEEEDIHEGDIVVTSLVNKRRFKQAIKAKAGLIIIVGNNKDESLIAQAKKNGINIIKTDLNILKISKLIYQSVTIDQLMITAEKVNSVSINETVDVCLARISKSRFRSYPILDENGKVVGSLSRYHLNNYKRKQLILVDHNETKQSIDDIEHGEVLEIIDHHRIGDFESSNPITITTKAVGATASIIANMFFDNDFKISKNLAGLLLGAILADTLNLNSPTTTSIDKEIAKKLEKISDVNGKKLYEEMLKHGESLQSKKSIDILYDDYKEYNINGNKIGIAQAICKSKDEYLAVKDAIEVALEEACKSKQSDLLICMLTNPTGSGSYLIAKGNKANIIEEIYPDRRENFFISKLMSRKKQLLPDIIRELS